MTDLTKITTPFGLLDAETQRALKSHGGPWEFAAPENNWSWMTVGGSMPIWSRLKVYRVKPAPPKPRECWSYGEHICNTEAEAITVRRRVANDYPGKGHENGPITKPLRGQW